MCAGGNTIELVADCEYGCTRLSIWVQSCSCGHAVAAAKHMVDGFKKGHADCGRSIGGQHCRGVDMKVFLDVPHQAAEVSLQLRKFGCDVVGVMLFRRLLFDEFLTLILEVCKTLRDRVNVLPASGGGRDQTARCRGDPIKRFVLEPEIFSAIANARSNLFKLPRIREVTKDLIVHNVLFLNLSTHNPHARFCLLFAVVRIWFEVVAESVRVGNT